MADSICILSSRSYPGGGFWGVSTGDFRFGEFDMIQLNPISTVSDEELEEVAAGAGPRALDFLRRLRDVPGIATYVMLNAHSFSFGVKDFRSVSDEKIIEVRKNVFEIFRDVYGFEKLKFS